MQKKGKYKEKEGYPVQKIIISRNIMRGKDVFMMDLSC